MVYHACNRDMILEASNTTNKMVVQIVSEENIVPSSPTPDHLRVFKLSVLDQIQVKIYVPLLLFFHNNQTSNLSSVNFDRSKLLKWTLSQTLTEFYPLAGKVKDDFHIDCNDEGVHYIETIVKGQSISWKWDDQPINSPKCHRISYRKFSTHDSGKCL